MRPDASGCVRMRRDFELQQISANSGKIPSQLKRSGNNPLQSEDDFITHPNVAAVLNVAKPVAQLDAHPVSSTTK